MSPHGGKRPGAGRKVDIPPQVVTRILQRHDEGAGAWVIARELNEAGVPTARGGKRWHVSTVQKVLARNSQQRH